jgi:hypothetical protein
MRDAPQPPELWLTRSVISTHPVFEGHNKYIVVDATTMEPQLRESYSITGAVTTRYVHKQGRFRTTIGEWKAVLAKRDCSAQSTGVVSQLCESMKNANLAQVRNPREIYTDIKDKALKFLISVNHPSNKLSESTAYEKWI